MDTKDLIELLQQIGRECNDAFVLSSRRSQRRAAVIDTS
jgi:hypothetical protein